MEELKTTPAGEPTNAPELVAKALDMELNPNAVKSGDSSKPAMVNDLTTMVKKKKKPVAANGGAEGNGKRKAEDDVLNESKKAKVEDASS